MAFFSRGKRPADLASEPVSPETDAHDAPASDDNPQTAMTDAAPQAPTPGGVESSEVDPSKVSENGEAAASAAPDAPSVPTVGISMSSFQGVGAVPAESAPKAQAQRATPRSLAPAEAPESTETVPGLRDNALLVQALGALSEAPAAPEVANVTRQMLQGQVFLRVHGDARTLLAEGKDLPLAVATQGDDQFVLAFSGGESLQASVRADGNTDTSAMGQPVLTVIRHVLSGNAAGLILDHASSPGRVILPRQLLQRALDEADPELAVKTILAAPRTDATASEVVAALPTAKLWIAANRPEGSETIGIAESRTADGERYLEVFTHPLEIVALGRSDQPVPVTAAQLGAALASDESITGLLVDPAGPWIRVKRHDLLPVIALAG